MGSPSTAGRSVILATSQLTPRVRSGSSAGRWAGLILGVRSVELPVPDGLPPIVGGLAPGLFRSNDPVSVDGENGIVHLNEVEEVRVVTSFLERPDGRILLLRRSQHVGSFRGHWAGVSGFLEEPTACAQAVKEVGEETGIAPDSLTLAAEGSPVYARDGSRVYVVTPFRFTVDRPGIHLDWEHTRSEWVRPSAIAGRRTVPKLLDAWRAVAPRSRRGAPASGAKS